MALGLSPLSVGSRFPFSRLAVRTCSCWTGPPTRLGCGASWRRSSNPTHSRTRLCVRTLQHPTTGPSGAQLFCFMILGGSQSDIEVLPLEAPVARWEQQARRRSSEAVRQAAGLKSGGKATVERGDPSTYMRMPAGSISEVAGQFCVGKAKCYHAKDRERLLAAIEAAYGDSAPFDEATPTHPPAPRSSSSCSSGLQAAPALLGAYVTTRPPPPGGARPP